MLKVIINDVWHFLLFSVQEMKALMHKAKKAGSERTLLSFNNYGCVNTKQQDNAEDHLVEATSLFNVVTEHNSPLTSLFTVNCVTINGRMCISVLYYTHQTSPRTAQEFAAKLKNILTFSP